MRFCGVILVTLGTLGTSTWGQDKTKETPAEPQQISKKIRGRVVDEAGKPIAGITLSSHWIRSEDKSLHPYETVAKTDEHGDFGAEITLYYGRSSSLLALDSDHKRGALVNIGPKTPDEPLTIKLATLVHLHGSYTCKDLGKPVGWTNTMLFSMPERWRISEYSTKQSEFSVLLPPGRYLLQGYGGSDVERIKRELTLEAGKPDVDLGAIDLAACKIAKLKGKVAPSLLATDARGVSKNVQIAGLVSLRSALELLLDPLDLAATIGPKGYVITRKPKADSSAEPPLSKMQQTCAARIERKLKESKYSFDFDKTPLSKVAAFFEQQSTENVVLDPRGRLQGKIDPEVTLTGTGKEVPLGEALEKLVAPLGLHVVVRDEVIVLELSP